MKLHKTTYKPITNTLFSFIKKEFPPLSNSLQLSEHSKENILYLFQEIKNAHKNWKLFRQEILNTKTESREIIKPNPEKYNYIPSEIREKIETECHSHLHYSYSFIILSRNFTVHFMCSSEINHTHVLQKLERIYMWFQIACKQNPNLECSKNIQIYLYCIDFEKVLPDSSEDIDIIHANTAFTTGCQSSTEIILFREEEWFKVLMHETFHNLGLDFIQLPIKEIEILEKKLREMFWIDKIKDIRFYETYCEIWADILNIFFIVYFMNFGSGSLTNSNTRSKNKNQNTRKREKVKMIKPTKLLREFQEKIIYESIFSSFQCAKILQNHKIHYSDFIKKGNETEYSREPLKQYQEKTYTFSYYILKSILFFGFSSFFDFTINQNVSDSKFQIFKFKLTLENGEKYLDIIIQNYQNETYTKTILKMESWIQKQVSIKNEKIDKKMYKQIDKNEIILNTLRMTMFEIKE